MKIVPGVSSHWSYNSESQGAVPSTRDKNNHNSADIS